jgi:HK97 family phage major capsid protein
MRKTQVIGPRARTFTSDATTLDVPREATFSAAAGVLEGGPITPADPTWASLTLTKKKSVVSTRSSREFIEDNAFNAVGFLSEQSARTLALYNDAQDVADGDGVGANQTEALEAASITEVDAAVLALAYADVVDIYYAIESQYRRGAVWMAASGVLKAMSNLLDGNNRPIFNPYSGAPEMLSGGQGDPGIGTIFGRPVLEVPATAGVLLFGDLNFYGVLDHGAIRAEVSEHEAFLTDEVTWKWVQRRDGRVLQTAAFAKSSGITV